MQNEYEAEERLHLSIISHAESEKKHRMEQLHLRRVLDPASAKIIEGYWERVEAMTERLEQVGTTSGLIRKLEGDMDELRKLSTHLMLGADRAKREPELALIYKLLGELGEVLEKLKKRHAHLAEEALLAYLFWNPATPNTMPKVLRDREKNKEKKATRARKRESQQEQRETPAKPVQAPQKERAEGEQGKRHE